MRFRYTAAAIAALAWGSAHAEQESLFRLSGFGTLAATYSSERKADFTGNFAQPNGAGFTSPTSLAPDSKIAGQLNAQLTEGLSGVVQVLSQHQANNSWTPNIEWANLRYKLTPEFSVRLGRIAAPTYAISESRLVSYANPWVRPPIELYGMFPATNSDGVDASYRSTVGDVNSTVQMLYGRTTVKIPADGGTIRLKKFFGINGLVESGSLSVRAGLLRANITLDAPGVSALVGGLGQFASGTGSVPLPAYQAASVRASELLQQYQAEGIPAQIVSLAASYDPGDWFATGEVAATKGRSFFSKSSGWLISGGYRIGNFTPYAAFAATKADLRPTSGISTSGLDPQTAAGAQALSGGINTVLGSLAQTQRSATVGLRWDFKRNLALKAQYDRVRLGENNSGRLGNVQPGFVPGGTLGVATVAVDFVF